MVKFDGMAGFKMQWLINHLKEELGISDEGVIMRAITEVLLSCVSCVEDAVADWVSDTEVD